MILLQLISQRKNINLFLARIFLPDNISAEKLGLGEKEN